MNESTMERLLRGSESDNIKPHAGLVDALGNALKEATGSKLANVTPGSAEEAAQELRKALGVYDQEQKQEGHDPLKMAIAGMVNRWEAEQLSKDCQRAIDAQGLENVQPASGELLVKMQDFAHRFKKRNPFAGNERLRAALVAQFGIQIIPDAPEQ